MIGIDFISVERVAKLANKENSDRVFTRDEISYAETKSTNVLKGEKCSQRDNTYAGLFCAKEAFLKAIGMGIGGEFSLTDVEVSHHSSGQPFIVESEKIKAYLRSKNLTDVCLSISHDNDYAIAVVEIR